MAEQICDNTKFTAVRLPSCVKPIHYDLSLKPDFENFTFDGNVKIQYRSNSPQEVQNIVLHANELEITEGYLHSGSNRDLVSALTKVTYSKDTETATLEFAGQIFLSGVLFLNFKGTLNDKMKGFYRSAFKIDDTVVHAVTTQFEATDARRCFPCWDEPSIKATFAVTLTFEQDRRMGKFRRVALSNTPVENTRLSSASREIVVSFKKTPIMSTYLLAFIIGPFERIEKSDGKRPIGVYTTPGKSEQGRFALEVACKSLQFYEEYFGIDYPLEKMDLIAIPDFASGAMENWGLVTYRETCLLVDPNHTSTNTRQYVALVVAHELAHQWFGNLVTMEWWTHLWLNEGFASFMEYLCVDHIFPEYDIWSQFLTDAYGQALDLDSLHNSHPIEVPVEHPSEVDEIFDAISYSKGASVIRMLYNYIGDEMFRLGMKDYLTKFAYKNAITEDLWDSLGGASKKPVRKFMSGWTSQKGFPWLSVTSSMEGDKIKLRLTQSKFTADGKIPAEEADMSWLVPVAAITGSAPTRSVQVSLLEDKTGEIVVEGAGDSWVKLNPGTVSFYRTAYPESMTKKLWPAIMDQTLPPMDRLGLQNDFFALCQAGKVGTVELLKLLSAFKAETNYTVWRSIDSCIGRLNIVLANTDYQDKFHSFGRNLYSEILSKTTWTPQSGEKDTAAMTRALVLNRLVAFGEESVINEAKNRFKAHREQSAIVPADLRGAVYRAVATHGDDQSFDSLFDIYRTDELHEEKDRILRALGFVKSSERLQRVIDFALSDEVRNQDKPFVLVSMGATSPSVAWKLLQDNKDQFREMYETGHLMARIIKFCTQYFSTEERAQEVAKFFKENKFPGTERTVQQSLETIRLNADWLNRSRREMQDWSFDARHH